MNVFLLNLQIICYCSYFLNNNYDILHRSLCNDLKMKVICFYLFDGIVTLIVFIAERLSERRNSCF